MIGKLILIYRLLLVGDARRLNDILLSFESKEYSTDATHIDCVLTYINYFNQIVDNIKYK